MSVEARKKAQSVKCLLCKHRDLGSDPQFPFKKQSVLVRDHNPSPEEVEIEVESGEFQFSERWSQKHKGEKQLRKTPKVNLWHTHTYVCIPALKNVTHMHTHNMRVI